MLTKKIRTGKCWFENVDFDHFGMCFGCFGAHFGPGGVPKTAPARHFGPGGSLKQPQHVILGVFGLILDPGGSLKQPQHVKKVKNNSDQKDAYWKMLV